MRKMPNRARRDIEALLVQWVRANRAQLPEYLLVDVDEAGAGADGGGASEGGGGGGEEEDATQN